jgi:co-chaperonin GroES (HSP10)
MITPIEDIVVVAPEIGAGAIEVLDPRSALRGRVLAVGPGRMTSDGVLIAADIRVNDMVRLSPGKSIEAIFDQKRVWITREREILAVEA